VVVVPVHGFLLMMSREFSELRRAWSADAESTLSAC